MPHDAKPVRLDAFLGGVLRDQGFSREKIKQAITEGLVGCNGEICLKPNTRIYPGDTITAALSSPKETLAAEPGELQVIYHDNQLAVLHKPAGLTVHPAPGLDRGTLAHRLLHYFPQIAAQGGLRPGIVHRLDKDTSGLMLVALSEKTRLALAEAFAARTVHKEYLALVYGVPRPAVGSIREPLGRSAENKTKMAVMPVSRGGKEARSDYETLLADPGGRFSMVRVAIHTGRTHQIRAHMRHIGHPLLGDAAYAAPGLPCLPVTAPRQMLHAWKLSFTHPDTAQAMAFTEPPPDDFAAVAAALFLPMQRIVVTGSPGGGKSTLTNALQQTGLPGWSADDAVRRLYANGADGWYVLQRRFGQRFIPDDKADVDKKALFAAMLDSETLRLEVEHLIHPLVRHDLEQFWTNQETKGQPAAVAEIPLALESGWLASRKSQAISGIESELLVTVYCPFSIRQARLHAKRGWPPEMIAAMESWQWPEEAKVRAADIVVDNSGTAEELRQRSLATATVLSRLREGNAERVRAMLESLWRA